MAHTTESPPCHACPTDPSPDRDATALPNLTALLRVVQILLTYGRHLADTFDRRSIAPGFHLIARHLGTSNLAVILAHIRRGILRATALQHVLLQRAKTGRDLTRPHHRARQQPQALEPEANPAAPSEQPKPAKRARPARPSWRDDWLDGAADPLDPCHLPKFEDLVKQVSRRPFGRTLGDIFADLGIGPRLCQTKFWDDLFFAMLHYDGNPAIYDLRRWRREQHFEEEQDRRPTMDLSWPPLDVGPARRDILQMLGFLIGEPPVEPPGLLPPDNLSPAQTAPAARPSSPKQTAPPVPPATGPP
jgi:hypothetical protein